MTIVPFHRFSGLKKTNYKLSNKILNKSAFISKQKTIKSKNINILTYITGVLMALSFASCFSDKKVYSTENFKYINIEYVNVKEETAMAIKDAITDLDKKNNLDFLDDVYISVVDDYGNLKPDNSFKKHIKESKNADNEKGCSFYSDKLLPKNIIIQESAHRTDKILNALKGNGTSSYKFIRQSLMHEIGHQFDSYYGHDHDAEFAKVWDKIQQERENNPNLNPYTTPVDEASIIAKINYGIQNGLSDKQEFKNAILKDLRNISKLRGTDKLASNIDYYISTIDFTNELTPQSIDLYDAVRAEVYANLFSYAIGEDDNNKAKFVNNFISSFKIVQKDIQKYINK